MIKWFFNDRIAHIFQTDAITWHESEEVEWVRERDREREATAATVLSNNSFFSSFCLNNTSHFVHCSFSSENNFQALFYRFICADDAIRRSCHCEWSSQPCIWLTLICVILYRSIECVYAARHKKWCLFVAITHNKRANNSSIKIN